MMLIKKMKIFKWECNKFKSKCNQKLKMQVNLQNNMRWSSKNEQKQGSKKEEDFYIDSKR
jgi:hypothetical protein